MTFGNGEGRFKPVAGVDQAGADALVERSLAVGINFFDTADCYSTGESEQMLGRSLKTIGVKRSDVIVATKVSSDVGTGPNDRGSSRGHIMDSIAGSLDRLGVDHIDLYQIHHLNPLTPEEETLRALDDLVSQRLVRYIGCSNWPAWQIAKALGISAHHGWAKFDTVQAYYSIAGRDLEREIVPMMADQKVGLLVWSPLAGGPLSGKFDAKAKPAEGRRTQMDFPVVDKERAWACIEAMRGIARKHTTSVARVALAWMLSKGFVTSIACHFSRASLG
jgi:aryl-alcohol dehydrogenase-like predicted oxidoreductase